MIALACFSFLCGAVLAQRFMVLILLPAIALGATAVTATAAAAGLDGWWTLLAICVIAVTLQLGYLAGICTHAILQRRARQPQIGQHRSQAAAPTDGLTPAPGFPLLPSTCLWTHPRARLRAATGGVRHGTARRQELHYHRRRR